jgi:protein TonB
VLAALVTRDGTVENLKVVRGPEVLARAAVEAVRHWRYLPYRLDGEPVDVQTTLTLKFTLQP